MRVLSRRDVEALLDPAALLDALATAMADLSSGGASVPPRIAALVDDRGLLAAMPGYSPGLGILAAKLVTQFPGNAGTPIPTHQAVIAVFDAADGRLTALLDGDAVTAARTAAGAALSTRLLARPDARVLTVVGTGVQARAAAVLTAAAIDLAEIRITGRDRARAAALARDLAGLGLPARDVDLAGALAGADVVSATTHAATPVVRAAELDPGVHVTSVGFVRGGGELDPALLAGALVAVEHRDTVLAPFPVGSDPLAAAVAAGQVRAADLVELGELVAAERPGRTSPDQRTVYVSVGVAVQDAAAAAVVLAAAERAGAGVDVEL